MGVVSVFAAYELHDGAAALRDRTIAERRARARKRVETHRKNRSARHRAAAEEEEKATKGAGVGDVGEQ